MRFVSFFIKFFFVATLVICSTIVKAQNAEDYVARGDEFRINNDFDQAIKDYTKAIKLKPTLADAYHKRGISYGAKNQLDSAILDLNRAIKLGPNSSEAYSSRGFAYLNKGMFDQAIKDYTKAISLDPGNALAYSDRGTAYLQIKEFDRAVNDYTKAISLDPINPDSYALRGDAYMQNEQIVSAINDFTQVISLKPRVPDYYIIRGNLYLGSSLFDLAIQDFNAAISLDPYSTATYDDRGFAYFQKNQLDSAIMDLNRAISLDTANAANYNKKGLCYNSLGKYEPAIQNLKISLAKDPEEGTAYINIISPLTRMLQFTEAKIIFDQYRQKQLTSFLDEDHYKFYRHFIMAVTQVANMAGRQASDDMLETAFSSLENASKEYGTEIKKETKRSYVDILFLKGYILERMNQNEEAKIIYAQSLAIDTRQPDLEEALQRIQKKQVVISNADKQPPEIILKNPAASGNVDIASDYSKTTIVGRAKDVSGIASVKINDIVIDNVDEDGLFVTDLLLKPGPNSLVITASDKQGNTASTSFTINGITPATRGGIVENTKQQNLLLTSGGPPIYYAIFIGASDYEDGNIADLEHPVNDARELKALLESKYTFDPKNIDTLYNRSRLDIMQAIAQRSSTLKENDNLLIFYAGHGTTKPNKDKTLDGFLIPSDARKGLFASYISIFDLKSVLKNSDAKHILLVADACFSGALTRSLSEDASKAIQKQYESPSRAAMTSGNLETVPDISVFIRYLKQKLTDNKEKYLTAKELFDSFYTAVLNNTNPATAPLYRAIQDVGDEGGEFIFIKK